MTDRMPYEMEKQIVDSLKAIGVEVSKIKTTIYCPDRHFEDNTVHPQFEILTHPVYDKEVKE